MVVLKFFPRHIRITFAVVVVNFFLFLLFRLAFLGYFSGKTAPMETETIYKSLYIGLKFDLRLSLLIALPVLTLAWLPGLNLSRSSFGRKIWLAYLTGVTALVVLAYFLDFGHYAYLNTRVNSTVLRFLQTPDISARMVWESYPVIWGALGFALLIISYGLILSRLITRLGKKPSRRVPGWSKSLAVLAFSAFFLMGLYGKISYYPLRWSEAFYTPHPLAVAIGLNPILYFYQTASHSEREFDIEEVRKFYPEMASYLGVKEVDRERLLFSRRMEPTRKVEGHPNVVVIFLESFAAFKVGAFGNPLDSSPNFDSLAREGWHFKNFYVPSTGTARSIFTAIFGIPDVSISSTSSFNPLAVNQHTVINAFADYDKFYFIGGSANWRNIRGMLSHNIAGLRIYEEGDYTAPRTDVWGLSDLHLLEEANKVLRSKTGKPFFAIIQTAGNHRPYTIPEDNRDFKLLDPEVENLNEIGFDSVEELNSFRFLDHSLGVFMDLARREPYFANTLFVVFGDHGLPGYGSHFAPGMGKHQLTQHKVPLLFYGPGLLGRPREFDKIGSELDIMPTIASLLGKPYLNTTLGRDLLNPLFDQSRYAFIFMPNNNPPPVGVLDRKFYYLINSDQIPKLYLYLSDQPEKDVKAIYPERAARMDNLARGYFETARYMLYHNKAVAAEQPN